MEGLRCKVSGGGFEVGGLGTEMGGRRWGSEMGRTFQTLL